MTSANANGNCAGTPPERRYPTSRGLPFDWFPKQPYRSKSTTDMNRVCSMGITQDEPRSTCLRHGCPGCPLQRHHDDAARSRDLAGGVGATSLGVFACAVGAACQAQTETFVRTGLPRHISRWIREGRPWTRRLTRNSGSPSGFLKHGNVPQPILSSPVKCQVPLTSTVLQMTSTSYQQHHTIVQDHLPALFHSGRTPGGSDCIPLQLEQALSLPPTSSPLRGQPASTILWHVESWPRVLYPSQRPA